MTLLEKVKEMYPELGDFEPNRFCCPSHFGLPDLSNRECLSSICFECWNREYFDPEHEIKVMLDPGATLPTRGHDHDAGLDLYSREAAVITPGKSAVFDTGVHMAIPRGYAGVLISKSGLNVKFDCTSTGLIDADYTGSIAVKIYNQGYKTIHIAAKQKISQLVLVPIITPKPVQVDSLDKTERGSNGFGSTGAF